MDKLTHKLHYRMIDFLGLRTVDSIVLLTLSDKPLIYDKILKKLLLTVKISSQVLNKVLLKLLKIGAIQNEYKVKNDKSVEYYALTKIGRTIVDFYEKINIYFILEEEKMSLRNNKYSKEDYENLVALPLERKIARTHTALVKIASSFNIVEQELTNSNKSKVLSHLVRLVKTQMPENNLLPQKLLSPNSISDTPDIFNSWAINGCYNPDSPVNYPLALWIQDDYSEYIKRFIKGEKNGNV